jgi:hypothetical protein
MLANSDLTAFCLLEISQYYCSADDFLLSRVVGELILKYILT